ncbi:tubulin-specific chaperone E [Histomonas meleagridis]|uniref:tubulin-specific chaperone E n=1 Tax=Histomonas meleagridis TaxID=135588 RepID=UPI00355A51BF|nr:tubulin-specific chaperone E [Histomonas meleagridis]
MPKLEDLQIQRNPIQDSIGEIETRLLCVARFPCLKKLNGSPITPSEIQQSEIQYLEYFSKDVVKNGPQRHPRWNELCQKYGAPQVEQEKVVQKKRAAVKFVFNGRTIEKTVPLSMKIGTLNSHVTRMFKIQGTEIELAIQTGNYKTSLLYPEQTLLEVGCNDGSIIFAAKAGDMELNEDLQAKSFKIRSISQQIEKSDI